MHRVAHTAMLPIEEYEQMRTGLARYEYVRTLTPQKFAELWSLCTKEGIQFDKQIDAEIAYERQQAYERIRKDCGG